MEQTQSKFGNFCSLPSGSQVAPKWLPSCCTTFRKNLTIIHIITYLCWKHKSRQTCGRRVESWMFLLAPSWWIPGPVLLLSHSRCHAPALASGPEWPDPPRPQRPPLPSWKMTTRQRRVWRRCWAIRSYICKKTILELLMWRVERKQFQHERKQFQHLSFSKESSETSLHVECVRGLPAATP